MFKKEKKNNRKQQFEAYYVTSDMKWYDHIKSHNKGLGQIKTCLRMEKKNEKQEEKLKEKDRIE